MKPGGGLPAGNKINTALEGLPLFFRTTRTLGQAVYKAHKAGLVRRVAHGLYTKETATPLDVLVPTRLHEVIAAAMPLAVLSARSATLGGRPAPDGSVFITWTRTTDIELPGGITLRAKAGPLALESDAQIADLNVWISSEPRQLLEHLERTHPRGGRVARSFSRLELEQWLDRRVSMSGGEDSLNKLRDGANAIAPLLNMDSRLPAMNELIGAFLGTRQASSPSRFLLARQRGRPYDETRVELLDVIRDELMQRAPSVVPLPPPERRTVLPFVDAYFSNFIEGTRFAFDEAAAVIFDGVEPAGRPADAHDIRGSYRLLADEDEWGETPGSPEHLRFLLQRRHQIIMAGRPERNPGVFKTLANQAGATLFVNPQLVEGTLDQGFARYAELTDPFARAVFLMFLVSEVHPFDDGNGRLARAMMNLELLSSAQAPVLVPTVLRENYVMALRAMTHNSNAKALIAVLDFGRRYAAALDASTIDAAQSDLMRTNAFHESDDDGIRLLMPTRP